jgi:hypothetical protein
MAQKTNLNVSPYFDDFSEPNVGAKDKNYYKVLFRPGKPIQTRELNTLQSILQNQVESFGSHIFKEGSMVIPGNVTFDNQFYAVKVNSQQYGVDLSTYISSFVGKKITGQVSGVSATVQLVQLPTSDVDNITLYVKYINSDSNFEINPFQNNETLSASETVGSIVAGTPFATTTINDSTSVGSAASVDDGIYFIRGTFVKVEKQTIILDYYTNTPSYRVGLRVNEQIITEKDDSSLYDNSSGFTNYAAPGAHRFKISLTLTKKPLTDTNDTDFVEILRVKDGTIQKVQTKSSYSLIKDYLAQRTYDESGDYVVDPFEISLNESLNDRLGNNGIFFSNEKTSQGNTPSDSLACVKLSPGKAYVRGYDIEKNGVEIIDVPKPRTTQTVSSVDIPFEMGNLIRINNVSGIPKQKSEIYFQNQRKNSNTVAAGTTIGSARVYTVNVTDSAYSNSSTNWDLYLYDIQTYTELTLNRAVSSIEIPATSFIKGQSSGATGYAVSAGSGTNVIRIRQTSGVFSVGEQILINGTDIYPRTVSSVKVYGIDDIKSVHQPTSISGFTTAFISDTQLDRVLRTETITISAASGGVSTVTVATPSTFSGIKTDTIIRYQRAGISTEIYNRIVSISPALNSMTVVGVNTVLGVCDGSLPTSQFVGAYSLGAPKVRNDNKGFLYAQLPNSNISSTNLNSSTITFSAQTNPGFTHSSSKTITVNTGSFNLGINSTSAKFQSFDEERYSIFYTDGSIETLTSDKVSFPTTDQVTFSNISADTKTIACINATFIKNNIQTKVKQYNRSRTLDVIYSKNPQSGVGVNTSVNDGLTYNQYYGLRVQDEEISLNYPDVVKVLAIYESLDTSAPELDKVTFSSIANVTTNAIIGENIIGSTSNSIARVVSKPSSDTLGIVYLNNNKFISGENVVFEESNIKTNISSITIGKYRDVTSKFTLDKGQKEQYYDYSKIIRKTGESSPSRRLLIVFDHYTVPTNDNGDVFTIDSYDQQRYSKDIPNIGKNNIRASDTLDFRPRVSVFTSTTSSPFDFSSRTFGTEPKIIMSPNESSLIGYSYYLGRIDKIYLDKLGNFSVLQGIPSLNPKSPSNSDDVMEIATVTLPPYLYDTKDVTIALVDNRRYTMRDIGAIEDRVETLEKVTSLSLLEINTQTLQIQDAQGLNRFKTGFFVDDFKTTERLNTVLSTVTLDNGELVSPISKNSIKLYPVSSQTFTNETLDLNSNFELFDKNVQKTGDVITLKYDSVNWIEQTFATKVENVNPFHVISYSGNIKLTPESDSWVRTIQLQDVYLNQTTRTRLGSARRFNVVESSVTTTVQNQLISSGTETFMRSRNTGISATNLKAFTRYYQFLDGNSGVKFIPKLIEIANDSSLKNYGASSSFQVGETVIGTVGANKIITFRVAQSNHKTGPYNNPSAVYTINPYLTTESIPSSYSASSKILNIDIDSLCLEAQGLYSGFLSVGVMLVGQTSGAIAYVKDLRLITDINGSLSGSFFLDNPNTSPPPSVRISTGSKVYKLTSSSTNEIPLPGSTLISSGETIYKSEGTWEQRQKITTTTTSVYYVDPLAQTFSVGEGVDSKGAYLTAIDLFFASKDTNNAPLTVEIRTVELGTPTRNVVGRPVTLNPQDISISTDASVATKVTFDYPIYLTPNLEYAIVLLSPQSDKYEVWIAEMGQKTIETSNLPDSQAVRYTRQFAIGSLFKSQNGSIWTSNQYQDLKFKLYKANFTSNSGSVILQNPTLDVSNGYIPTLNQNPITILPRKVNLGITTTTNSTIIGILTTGRKISVQSATYNSGYIVGTGSSVTTVGITTGGTNYTTGTVQTYNIIGSGTGLRLNITATSGTITGVAVSSVYPGNGYKVGDVVGIVTSTVSPVGGRDAQVTITGIGTGIDTLYLTNVQGNAFNVGVASISYYDNSGNLVSLANTTITSSTPVGGFYSGNYFKVNHFDHGMYANNNKIAIYNVASNVVPTNLTSTLSTTDTTISIASTSDFTTFENISVSATNPGYVKIDNEIIKYTSFSNGSLSGITRGIDSTLITPHDNNTQVYKYELGGVSLRRINKTHDISDTGIGIDDYYVEFDRSNFDSNVTNRLTDQGSGGSPSNSPQLSFSNESSRGGNEVQVSENIQYNKVTPHIALLSPSSDTSVSGQIRTVSGTSVSGNETSFIDQQYENVELDKENQLTSTRIVCSNVNEQQYLNNMLRNKSFTMKVDLNTSNSNLSPMIFWKQSSVEFINNRLNAPIQNYSSDSRVNSILNDPHAMIYYSNTVNLSQPSTALKVIVSAYRHASSDFRVLYSLIRPDSSEIESSFELFPGYDNLTLDNNQDGYYDIVDVSKNSGLPDVYVPPSLNNQFLDYEFSVNNLGYFTGYTIKIVASGTNQAYTPRFKDLRSIALA